MSGAYLGDFAEDATLHHIWNTNDSSGASITRATNGTISVYKDNGLTQSTAGITDTEDFDGLTGVHALTIDLSADAFYATGSNYSVVLSAATIDGQTVNAAIAHFSIENRFMRGTDSAALSSVCTEARLAELAAANLPTDIDAILADTGTDGVLLTSAYDFAKGTVAMTEAYAANAAAMTPVQAFFAIHQMLMQFGISGTSLTVRKLDDATTAFVVPLDDATNPTDAKRV